MGAITIRFGKCSDFSEKGLNRDAGVVIMVSMKPERRNLSVYGAMDPQTESSVSHVIKASNG
jgi:hypothetical protein